MRSNIFFIRKLNKLNTATLLDLIQNALENVKAQNIVRFDTRTKSLLFEAMVIASGTSERQVAALARRAVEDVKKNGGDVLGVEDSSGWVLVDFGAVLLNVMSPDTRAYYNLEELWG